MLPLGYHYGHLIIMKSGVIKIVSGEGEGMKSSYEEKVLYFISRLKIKIFYYLDFTFCYNLKLK